MSAHGGLVGLGQTFDVSERCCANLCFAHRAEGSGCCQADDTIAEISDGTESLALPPLATAGRTSALNF